MKIQHSPQRTQHVIGAVAARHGMPRAQLQAVVADALEAALIYDHDNQSGARADSIRTDSAPTPPPARSPADARQEAAEAMKNQYRTKNGTGGAR